jgi:hypothetical protein
MKKNRDDFTPDNKRVMAERVAWKCSFPRCGKNTVGPNSADHSKKINNGIAAHICAAAPNGPRYDQSMTTEQRKSIENGIWMCRDHGSLIDFDDSEYSVETLKEWKQNAENNAAKSLREPTKELVIAGCTFLQLGSELICNVRWSKVNTNSWSFELVSFEIGTLDSLQEYILNFNNLDAHEKYVVIESQGDARLLSEINLNFEEGCQFLDLVVVDKHSATDPNHIGFDLKLTDDGDLCILGGIQRISGKEAAVQQLSTSMGLIKGEIKDASWLGSKISEYYQRHSNDLILFARLIKLEFIRLSLIPFKSHMGTGQARSLPFVKRFNNVQVLSTELLHSSLSVFVCLEWGDDTTWEGNVRVFVNKT